MKNLFQDMSRRKRLVLALAPLPLLVAVAAFLLLLVRHSPGDSTQVSTSRGKKGPGTAVNSYSGAFSKAKPSVLTPILLADEAFRGYDLPKVLFSEKEKREEGTAARERATTVKDSGFGQQITVPGEKKIYKNSIAPESKLGLSKDSHDGQQEATDSPGMDPARGATVGKDAQPYGRPADLQEHRDELSEDVKLIEEMATEAGFSKDEGRKIIQSYRDLCRVIPKSEARKIIKVRIGIAYNK